VVIDSKVRIKLPDGRIVEASPGRRIIYFIPKNTLAIVAKINNKLVDLTEIIRPDWKEIEILDFNSREGRDVYWHSAAHILAQAVKRLFPKAKLGTGWPTETGFFYDFDIRPLSPDDLKRIEKEMKKIIQENIPIEKITVTKEEARKIFEERGERYKLEIIDEIPSDEVTIYKQGEFIDLCRGPHVPRTGLIKHVKLLSVSSCYWKGDEGNPVLQRIYGIAFPTESQLKQYLKMLEEAKKRDHRVLGPKLGLFMMPEEIGAGLVIWLPKGAILRRIIEDFLWDLHIKHGYQFVISPHLARAELWRTSGHLEYYREYMWIIQKKNQLYCVKPMNCPFHILIYKSKRRSYRELPLRLAEFGTVYRYERSGVLHGLLRVRGFTQDDAHIFCRPDQLLDELINVIRLMKEILGAFGFKEFEAELSLRDPKQPKKFMGTDEDWEMAENALRKALEVEKIEYIERVGEAAFYGPKIDVHLTDSLGRKWQCSTIQLDFNLPKRFNLTYVDKDGSEKLVVMIHRALIGSFERFIGILIEHYAGNFPTWLAPIQVRVIPVQKQHIEYARKVLQQLIVAGIRADIDESQHRLSRKIRVAEQEKIPYMIIIGEKEVQEKKITVRKHRVGNLGSFSLDEFLERILEEIRTKRIE